MTNREQIEFWNGPVSERWVALQPEFDRALRGFGEAAIERLRLSSGERVLDVGCGAGDSTLAIARRVGETGQVVGLDVSEPLLCLAKARASKLSQTSFVREDAAEARFPVPFHAAFSRFGVMFFTDPVATFRNLGRALAPAGRLAFCCWRALSDNPWCDLPFQAARRVLPDEPFSIVPRAPGPFAFEEPDYVRQILSDAGFLHISVETVTLPVLLGEHGLDQAAEILLRIGPTSRLLQNASDEQRARAKEAILSLLAVENDPEKVTLPGSAWVVTARVPE